MSNIHFDLISLLILIGISQGIFLAIIIFFQKKGNHTANIYMAATILAMSFSIFFGILIKTNLYLYAPHLLWTGYPFQLLFGPFLFLYIKRQVNPEKKLSMELIHFIPFVLIILLMAPYFKLSGAEKIYLAKHPEELKPILPVLWLNIATQIQIWIYIVVIWKTLNRHEKSVKQNYSNISKVNLKWIRDILYQIGVIFIVLSLIIVIRLLFPDLWSYFGEYLDQRIIPILVSIAIYRAGYKALTQLEILFTSVPETTTTDVPQKPSGSIDQRILNFMENKKPFLDPDLTLPQLAEELQLTRNQLSAMINQETGSHFFDFINSYRIEQVKKDLHDTEKDQFTILALALDAGFNSKATFNKVFKKVVGMTPRQYKQLREG